MVEVFSPQNVVKWWCNDGKNGCGNGVLAD